MKGLYEKLFGEIMQYVNHRFSCSSSENSISVLDIAGFGGFKKLYCAYFLYKAFISFFLSVEYLTDESNTFDQLCINYTNERMQNLFVTRKISDEKHWYNSQGLDIPFVEFFDNSCIIGMISLQIVF